MEQKERLELIDTIYEVLKEVRKTSHRDDLYNIATSYHNTIIEVQNLYKDNGKDPEDSLLYGFINLYLNDNLLLGKDLLEEYIGINEYEEFPLWWKVANRLIHGKEILNSYIEIEKDIRYFSIEKDIVEAVEKEKYYWTLQEKLHEDNKDFNVNDIIGAYNKELKELNINVVIPPLKSNYNNHNNYKVKIKKHIRKN